MGTRQGSPFSVGRNANGTAWPAAGWGRTANEGDYAMGRNVTLGIGTLIIILIIVALVF